MSYLNGIQQQRAEEIERQSGWDCGRHEDTVLTEQEQSEHEQQCLDAMLEAYITEEGNYAVNGASIKCSQMTGKPVFFKFDREGTKMWIEGEKGIATKTVYPQKKSFDRIVPPIDKGRVGKLFAVHGETQTVNGIPYATVIDRTCLRQETNSKDGGQDKCDASIVSCGNCKLLLKHDIENIAGNWDKAVQYGTCYCLIKPREEWTNPRCTESVVGNCDTGDTVPECKIERHHHTMTFSTTEGDKEGLTMLSTLLCYRGGIITIEKSGQGSIIIKDMEQRISEKVDEIRNHSIDSLDEMKNLETIEILARMIYQESHTFMHGEQNAILYSVINRIFSPKYYIYNIYETPCSENNTLKNILLTENQYESIRDHTSGSYHLPEENSLDYKGWENAKRLAAIMMIALEDNLQMDSSTNDVGTVNIIKSDIDKRYIINDVSQQCDSCGAIIENLIENKTYFKAIKNVPEEEGMIYIYTDGERARGGHVFWGE